MERITDEKTRLLIALQQINNVEKLLKDNEWETYLYSHLTTIEYELQRQLSNITKHDRRRFQESGGEHVDAPAKQRS